MPHRRSRPSPAVRQARIDALAWAALAFASAVIVGNVVRSLT